MLLCLCIWVSPISVLMKHVLRSLLSHLSLQLRRKAIWVSHEYMLQQCTSLSNRNSVKIISVSMGLSSNSPVVKLPSVCKQGVVNVCLFCRELFSISVKLDNNKKKNFYSTIMTSRL